MRFSNVGATLWSAEWTTPRVKSRGRERGSTGPSKARRNRIGREPEEEVEARSEFHERELALPLFDRASVLDGKQRKARQSESASGLVWGKHSGLGHSNGAGLRRMAEP